ncbi:hypothetical protein [Bradyrhizobium sp. WSM2793]|uniref:hypothetical protein n=1 Tax=Bradyrhizobium sp. WSM2793 TaxID=1038866 RepID=UPI001AEC5BD1|nr:hypothetical protein [Bradyrhizobium sp. WSM2793]
MNDGLAHVRSRWVASLGAADGVHYRFKAPTLTTLSICSASLPEMGCEVRVQFPFLLVGRALDNWSAYSPSAKATSAVLFGDGIEQRGSRAAAW